MASSVKISYGEDELRTSTSSETVTLKTTNSILKNDIIIESSLVADDVRFLDYDGTIVSSYSKEGFLALTELPANPTHTGLTAQGWNWTLADAKTYVNKYETLDIGQMYITDDGKTRLYVHLESPRLHPYVGFGINGTATINWGDGNTSTVTGTDISTTVYGDHEYAQGGDYVVTIDGQINIFGSSSNSRLFCKTASDNANFNLVYANCIQKIELGNIYGIGNYAFYNCSSLRLITIPDTVTSIENNAFYNCYSFQSINIPDSVTSIGTSAFYQCSLLTSINIPNTVTSIGDSVFSLCTALQSINIPNSVTSISSSAFQSCSSLTSINIPDSVTSIGDYAFSECSSLTSITIPDSVTSVGNFIFYYCLSLTSINIPNNVTSIGTYTFQHCSSLASINIPNTVTSIGNYVFYQCFSLQSINIPDSVTSIDQSAFYSCSSLTSINIPDTVTSIGMRAFYYCYGLGEIHFKRATPPTVSNSNAWSNIPTDCKIYVPTGTLSAYTSASNYPSSSTYTYIEE